MYSNKIIFTGPVGAGKSTAIAMLSDIPPISTYGTISDLSRERKAKTRAALDFGVMNLDGGERLHLFGIPNQECLDTMQNIIVEGGIGLVLLINNSAIDPFHDLHLFLDTFGSFIKQTRVVIGITRMDEVRYPTIADYYLQLEERKHTIPIFEVDAREHEDVEVLVDALLYTWNHGLVA
ncbi:MAG: GTP-binding protein [Gammaproteobacteria bacterium]|nr:GTP-binding protein [Gammaproteobacteria bacterium]